MEARAHNAPVQTRGITSRPPHWPARLLGHPEGERGRVVLAGDAVVGHVAVEVVEPWHVGRVVLGGDIGAEAAS